MFLAIFVTVALLATVVYVTWLYRQGSFPRSRMRKHAKRAARRSQELDREDKKRS